MPNFVEIDKILLPDFLFEFKERKSKSISPTALINPANVNNDNIFQSLISPSSVPSKKTIIIDGQIDLAFDRARQIGFLKKLKMLGFDVYLCTSTNQNENVFYQIDDELSNIDQLDNLSDFDENNDYEKLANSDISREKSVFVDFKKLEEVKFSLDKNKYRGQFAGNSWESYFHVVSPKEFTNIRPYDSNKIFLHATEQQIESYISGYSANIILAVKNAPHKAEAIWENFGKIAKNHEMLEYVEAAPHMAEVIWEKFRKSATIDDVLKYLKFVPPHLAEAIWKKNKGKYEKDNNFLRYLEAAPHMAEAIFEIYGDKIENSRQLLSFVQYAPHMAETLFERCEDKIENEYYLIEFMSHAPHMAETIWRKYEDKIEDYLDKIRGVGDVVTISRKLSKAPEFILEKLFEKSIDKFNLNKKEHFIGINYNLIELTEIFPNKAEFIWENYRDIIEKEEQLLSFVATAPHMAEALLEKCIDNVKNSNDLYVLIKHVPNVAETVLEKHRDKITRKDELVFYMKTAPKSRNKTLQEFKNNAVINGKNEDVETLLPATIDEIIRSEEGNDIYSANKNAAEYKKPNESTFLYIDKLDLGNFSALKKNINAGNLNNISAIEVDKIEGNFLEPLLQLLPQKVKHLTLPKELRNEILNLPQDLTNKLQFKFVSKIADYFITNSDKKRSTFSYSDNYSFWEREADNNLSTKRKSKDIFINNNKASEEVLTQNPSQTYQMVKAGEVLNLDSSNEISTRTRIIDRNIAENLAGFEYVPSNYSAINAQLLSEAKINNLKNKIDGTYCKFEQHLTANKKFRLLSLDAQDEMVGVRICDENQAFMNDVNYKIEKGDDDFFYATANKDCVIEYVLKAPLVKPDAYKEIPINNPIRAIIDEYKNPNEGYLDLDDGREMPSYEKLGHKKFLEELFVTRSGACMQRVAAVEYRMACDERINRDDYRVVEIDNNHARLEVRFNNKWIAVDFGGARAEEIINEGKKYKPQAIELESPDMALDVKEEMKSSEDGLLENQLKLDKNHSSLPLKQKAEIVDEEKIDDSLLTAKSENNLIKKEASPFLQNLNTLSILVSCLEKSVIPDLVIDKADLITKTFYSNKEKTLIITKDTESHANFILEQAKLENRKCYYIDSPDKIDFDRLNLFINSDNKSVFRQEGLLHDFLVEGKNNSENKSLLLINWDAFNTSQKVSLNSLLDKEKRIHGELINANIIGFCKEKPNDLSFSSRHNLLLESQLKLHSKLNSNSQNNIIDLQGFQNWQQTLFGRIEVSGDNMLWQKSDFVSKIEEGIKDFEITNIDKKDADYLQYQFKQAKSQGYFSYHGYNIEFPQDLNVKIANQNFNFKKFDATNILVKKDVTFDKAALDCKLINTDLFDQVLRKKKIVNGVYEEEDGLIEECAKSNSDKILKLFISSNLGEGQWYSLLNQAKENDVKLNLYLAPLVKLPDLVKTSKIAEPEEAKDLNQENIILRIPNIFVTNSVEDETRRKIYELAAIKYYEDGSESKENDEDKDLQKVAKKANIAAIIDVEDMSYQDLVERIGFKICENGFKDFEQKESEVFSALKSGEKVILRGEFSEELLRMLEPIFISNEPDLQTVKDNLILIIEDKNCKSQKTYEPLKWLPNSYYEIKNYKKDQFASNQISYFEIPDKSDSLENSATKSEEFITKRKQNFSESLENHQMLRLVGHSGVGKSGLIKEFKQNNKDEVEIYRELNSFEEWANDKSNKKKILFIDESNIEDTHFTLFSPLKKDGNKRLLYRGKFFNLDENHKVVFACNPKEYGGGRVTQKLFDDEIPSIYLRDFSASYIYEELLKKPIFDGLNEALKTGENALFTEDKFKEICKKFIKNYQKTNSNCNDDEANKETVRELQEKVLIALDDNLNEESRKEVKTKNFISTNATFEAEKALSKVISIRQKQKDKTLTDKIVGLNGILIEGDSGIGKSEMIAAILEQKGISEIKLEDQGLEDQGELENLSYYKIDANMNLQKKIEIITKAYERGHIIWIDELNSGIDDGFEKIINLALTGDHPQGKEIAPKAGFMLISSINSIEFEGRSQISPALRHRLNVVQAKSLKEYSGEDMTKIVYNMASQNEELNSDQNCSLVCKKIANDFIELKKTKNGKIFNLRSLENNLDKIFNSYSIQFNCSNSPEFANATQFSKNSNINLVY